MKRIMVLEQELKLNKISLLRCQGSDDPAMQKETRVLLIQRSNLKDMLLERYRAEVIERIKDYEYASGS